MKVPDLAVLDDAGVHPWTGTAEPLKTAAAHAHLKFAAVDLARVKDRATLFAELDRALGLPEHFGHNFDALADVLEDRDWLGQERTGDRAPPQRRAIAASTRRTGPRWRIFSPKPPNSGRNSISGFWTFVG